MPKLADLPRNCRKFESRFEDYLGGRADSEFEQHLAVCEHCAAALQNSRLAENLLRGALDPAGKPSPAFRVGVMARIRREKARIEARAAFWAPLEFLASRLSVTAALVLLALSAYLVEFGAGWKPPALRARTELSTTDFPQPPGDPVSNEEVLQSLAERGYGR